MDPSFTLAQLEYIDDKILKRILNDTSSFMTPKDLHTAFYIMIFSLPVALIGIIGNSIILWLLGFHIQRNPLSVYILNLAVADILFLCCSFGVLINLFIINDIRSYRTTVIIVMGLVFLISIIYSVGMSLRAVISTECCLAVLFPIWYRCKRPKHMSALVCSVLWALPLLFCLVFLIIFIYGFIDNIYKVNTKIIFGWFLLLTCVMCSSSLTLLLRVQCSSQHQQPPRLFLLVLFSTLIFLLCGLPLGIIRFMWHIHKVPILFWLSWPLSCVNGSANPFIYYFLGRQRQRGKEPLRVVLERVLRDKQQSGHGTRDTLHIHTQETSF